MDADPSIPTDDSGSAFAPTIEDYASGVGAVCAGCRFPLTRRGAQGECLRCALRLVMDESEDDQANRSEETNSVGEFASSAAQLPRYGHFEVDRGFDGHLLELGSGAMATTFRARDTVLGTAVALKVISQNVASHPAARARFLREARAAACLHHPNVAAVTFYGEEGGECFYAMELVEGETLAERVLRAGVFSPAQALEIGVQVARALAAAEAVGVVHRDLKPSNLMLVGAAGDAAPTLHVKVIDWGLAKAVSADDALLGADHTQGGFVGTPAFASPEQFARHTSSGTDAGTGRIDVRSDIYSLGVTLWYLLCGKVPFVGDTLNAIHTRQKALPVEQLRTAKVPRALGELLKSMVAYDPARRPQSARELLDKLRDCQESYASETPGSIRRRRYRRFAGTLALCVLLTTGVGTWWQHTRGSRQVVASEKPVLAVLPFENLSSDPADAFFATGTQDELTNDLARIAALNVLSADSTRSYLPGYRDLTSIARETGARYLLEGGVNRQEGQVAINVRVVDARDPAHPWNQRFTRHVDEVFAVQGEIARAVAAHLRATLSDAEKAAIDRPPTTDLTAYDLYLRARQGIEQTNSSAEQEYRYLLETGVPLLEQAVARDPQFALAYVDLVHCYDRLVSFEANKGQGEAAAKHREQAEAALFTARRLRPEAGEVHLAQARHFFARNGNEAQVAEELALARRELPNSTLVEHLAGQIARSQNHWEDALRCFQRVIDLEPRNLADRLELMVTCRMMRRFAESNRWMAEAMPLLAAESVVSFRMNRAIGDLEQRADVAPLQAVIDRVTPADKVSPEVMVKARLIVAFYSHDAARATALMAAVPSSGLMWGNYRLPKAWFEALAARMRHDDDAAREAFARARPEVERVLIANAQSGPILGLLAKIDAGLGRQEEAVQEALHACELTPVEKSATSAPLVACDLATVYAWIGQPERACEVLEPWVDRPAGNSLVKQPMYGDFRLNPGWDPLRGNARFEALVARLAPEKKPLTPDQTRPRP